MKSKFFRKSLFSVGVMFFLMLVAAGCAKDDPINIGLFQITITSPNHTTFTEKAAGTFTVTATGTPKPTLSLTGTLPTGVTFNAATGVLSGTPAFGTSGTYPLVITATNAFFHPTQNFTLTIAAQPITSLTEVAQINNGDATVAICRDNYLYTVGWGGTANSFNIYDISTPASPVLRGHYNIGWGYGLALNGNYAYIQTDGSGDGIFAAGTLGVMNIADPAAPTPVMADDTGYSSAYQTYYYNGYIYNASNGIIGIYRVSDPATLVHVTNITTSDVEWAAFSGNYMYAIDDGTLRIWNITDPTAPVETGSATHASLGYGGIAIKGNYVFAASSFAAEILVFNVSDKTNPTLITTLALTSGTSTRLRETRILGNYLLIAGRDDFYVVNIANPTAPTEVTSMPLPNGYGWGFDVFNERYAIVADEPVYHIIKLW